MGRHSSRAEQSAPADFADLEPRDEAHHAPGHGPAADPRGAPALALLAPTLIEPSSVERTQPIPVQVGSDRVAHVPAARSGAPRHALAEPASDGWPVPAQRTPVASQPLPVVHTRRQPVPALPWSPPESARGSRFPATEAPSSLDGWRPPTPSGYSPPRTAPVDLPPPPQPGAPAPPPPLRAVPDQHTTALPAVAPARPSSPPPLKAVPTGPQPIASEPVGPTSDPGKKPSGGATREPRREEPAPRLLADWFETGRPAGLAEHLDRHGPLPRADFAGRLGADQLVALTTRAGLRGRGGAGFPTARKMAGVLDSATARRRPVVVANGCEGDLTSDKDRVLLHGAPHLVLDGIALAAHAVGADQAILCVHRDSPLTDSLEQAIAERADDPCDIHLVTTPSRYVASEASALVRFLTEGDARPTTSPPLPSQRGVQGRPTLVDNVETLAHLALLARHDDEWFRARGTEQSPGTMLVTVSGAVQRPGVYEVDPGVRAGRLLRLAGGTVGPAQAMLLGGLGGSWLPLPATGNLALSHEGCAAEGAGLGVASLLVLPTDACGLSVTSTIVNYLAGESARQCGPCMFGLPAVAGDLDALATGRTDNELIERLRTRLGVIPGRGACGHPDGAVRLAASAMSVFGDDVTEHLRGRPCGRPGIAALPMFGELANSQEGWR